MQRSLHNGQPWKRGIVLPSAAMSASSCRRHTKGSSSLKWATSGEILPRRWRARCALFLYQRGFHFPPFLLLNFYRQPCSQSFLFFTSKSKREGRDGAALRRKKKVWNPSEIEKSTHHDWIQLNEAGLGNTLRHGLSFPLTPQPCGRGALPGKHVTAHHSCK